MGGRGATSSSKTTQQTLTKDNWEKDMPKSISQKQKDAVKDVISLMERPDTYYTPYEITEFRVKPTLSKEDEEFYKSLGLKRGNDLHVTVKLERKDRKENPVLNALDNRFTIFFVGRNGGYYTFNKNGKKKNLSRSDVLYGNWL